MAKQVINFVLNTEADRDIIHWLARQENRSAAIREAIRDHVGRSGVTLGDVYQAVKGIERKLERGAVVVAGGGDQAEDTWDEPPEAAAALDALANL